MQIGKKRHEPSSSTGDGMKKNIITTLFLDIGGVLLTDGWGPEQRAKVVSHFNINLVELNERHHLMFDTYEEGKLTLPQYLKKVVFYESRTFTEEDFIKRMFQQSVALPGVIDYFKELKKIYNVRIIAVSNEGRELNAFRAEKFKLNELFDAVVSSAFVHLRKPDSEIFRMAIDIAQARPENSLYIDDRLLFVEVAQTLGMHGIHFQSLDNLMEQLRKYEFETSCLVV